MHLSQWKNLRDYALYGAFTFGVVFVGSAYSGAPIKPAYALIVALSVMLAVAYRDGQYRRVPVSMAATPARYVQEIRALLEGGIDQLRESQRLASQVSQSTQDLTNAVNTAQRIIADNDRPSVPLGRGFE